MKGHNIYQAGYTRMAGNKSVDRLSDGSPIGRLKLETIRNGGSKEPESFQFFVTCVGRQEDLKSVKENSQPSGMVEENMVNGSDLKLEISRKHISREKTGSRLQKLIRNGGIKIDKASDAQSQRRLP